MTERGSLAVMTSRQTFEWPTPQAFFDDLDREFGFTLDAAASDDNAKVSKYFTIEDDGLSQDWTGEVVWCNPPYGDQIKHWVYKAATSDCTTVMLVPARVDTKWFHDVVLDRAEVRFVRGRIKFEGAQWTAPFPCMVLVFRNPNPEGLR